ncbi:MAG: isoprenylcysteine carboxyl methyltransferase [Alphaproteobacteria bacterium]|nr:MAG: isoprenylcysteine carboxyl methyltransferase [Alphaproteobacteria bacterium]
MGTSADRPNRIPWPPVVLASALVAGIVLGRYVPLSWPAGMGADILQGAGIVLIVVAAVLVLSALHVMRKADTTARPDRPARHLVTGGPFAFTRNPIYLASVLLLAGLGLALANGWLLLAAAATAFADHRLAILREEAHLEARFGKAWRDYRKRVRRWL